MADLDSMIIVVRDVLEKTEGLVQVGASWYYAKVYHYSTILRVDLRPRPDMDATVVSKGVSSGKNAGS